MTNKKLLKGLSMPVTDIITRKTIPFMVGDKKERDTVVKDLLIQIVASHKYQDPMNSIRVQDLVEELHGCDGQLSLGDPDYIMIKEAVEAFCKQNSANLIGQVYRCIINAEDIKSEEKPSEEKK